MSQRQAEPDVAAALSAARLHSYLAYPDGEGTPVAVLDDGETGVEIRADMGSPLAAADALDRAAAALTVMAARLRTTAGTAR